MNMSRLGSKLWRKSGGKDNRYLHCIVFLIVSISWISHTNILAVSGWGYNGGESLPTSWTMKRATQNLDLVRGETLYMLATEPVLESHVASNIFHTLHYYASVPVDHVTALDEALLSSPTHASQASLLPWFEDIYKNIPKHINYIFIGTAYTRVVPENLEKLLQILKTEGGTGGIATGYGIRDEAPSIVHHFSSDPTLYVPYMDAGILLDRNGYKNLIEAFQEKPFTRRVETDHFHEIFKQLHEQRNLLFIHSPLFCVQSPVPNEYDRSRQHYPPPHSRPHPPQTPPLTPAANRSNASVTALEKAAKEIQGCVSFSVGNQHAPILSHQFFDMVLAFDEDILSEREKITAEYSVAEQTEPNQELQKKLNDLDAIRPLFMVEPEDVLIAVKTCKANRNTRLPILRRLWASSDSLVQMAARRSHKGIRSLHASPSDEQKALEDHLRKIEIKFFTDTPDVDENNGEVYVQQSVEGKQGLCEKMRGILEYFNNLKKKKKFLFVVDDDTLVNVRHLLDLLSMTLQAPIPARAFYANTLKDESGLRRNNEEYRKVGQSIENHLRREVGPWRSTKPGSERRPHISYYSDEELALVSEFYAQIQREMISPLYLGQRYGYGQKSGSGYPYITTGGGVVMDREAVERVLKCSDCVCPQEGTADDMILGMWMQRAHVPSLHYRGFHQEPPKDYSELHLQQTTPVSFHRLPATAEGSEALFNEYLDVGEYSPEEDEDAHEVDWIDHDWQHNEDVIMHEESDPLDYEDSDDTTDNNNMETNLPNILNAAINAAKKNNATTHNDVADHIERQAEKREEL